MPRLMSRTFHEIFPTIRKMNTERNRFCPTCEKVTDEIYAALMGRYASSHTMYHDEYQFKAAFFTILREQITKVNAKLRINDELRSLETSEALSGQEIISNVATNPDTEPSTDAYEPLEYVNQQNATKTKLGHVSGLYNLKHSLGGNAYDEFLDSFRKLFVQIIVDEVEWVYN